MLRGLEWYRESDALTPDTLDDFLRQLVSWLVKNRALLGEETCKLFNDAAGGLIRLSELLPIGFSTPLGSRGEVILVTAQNHRCIAVRHQAVEGQTPDLELPYIDLRVRGFAREHLVPISLMLQRVNDKERTQALSVAKSLGEFFEPFEAMVLDAASKILAGRHDLAFGVRMLAISKDITEQSQAVACPISGQAWPPGAKSTEMKKARWYRALTLYMMDWVLSQRVPELKEALAYWQVLGNWLEQGGGRHKNAVTFLSNDMLLPVFDFLFGMYFNQLLVCMPLFHLALAALAGAPNTDHTLGCLYDELRLLTNTAHWPDRTGEGATPWPYVGHFDKIRRAFTANRMSILKMVEPNPRKFFFDMSVYQIGHLQ
jgi:hypothetical protein